MSEDGSAAADSRKSAPQVKLAKELWERLAKSRPGPDNKELIYLARFVPLLSSAAAKTLLSRKLTLDELKELIQHVPRAQEAATKLTIKLYGDELTEEDLRFLVAQTKSVEVGRFLLKRHPNDANLGLIERTLEELKSVVEELRTRESTKNILREIDRKL